MKHWIEHLPSAITVTACGLALAHGPIAQLADYHAFADHSHTAGIPHAADVLSNLGFAIIAIWGWMKLRSNQQHLDLQAGWSGYRLFLFGLLMTALGSAFYHWSPDNDRLVWDRLPIALACAGLLAGVRGDTHRQRSPQIEIFGLSLLAVGSVGWWYVTELSGQGDLRPYLLLQCLPLILIPLWQSINRSPRGERIGFGVAILLYILAKGAELHDHEVLTALGWISGHTLKHLLATAAAATLVGCLISRVKKPPELKASTDSRSNGQPAQA